MSGKVTFLFLLLLSFCSSYGQETTLASLYFDQKPLLCTREGKGRVAFIATSDQSRVVYLRSNLASVSVPSSVVVPSGELFADFAIRPTAVASPIKLVVTATASEGSVHASLLIKPPSLASLSTEAGSTVGGSRMRVVAQLNAPASELGVVVQLTSKSPLANPVPQAAVIPPGQLSTTFVIETAPVGSPTGVTLVATDGVASRTATFVLRKQPVPSVWSLITTNPNRLSASGGVRPYEVVPNATLAVSYRSRHRTTTFGTVVRKARLVYANYTGARGAGELPGANPIYVRAAIEPLSPMGANDQSGTRHFVTFNGQPGVWIPPGEYRISDTVPVELYDQQLLFVRTSQTVESPDHRVCGGQATLDAETFGVDTGEGIAPGDLVAEGVIPMSSSKELYSPVAILGYTSRQLPSLALFGDSILSGLDDAGFRILSGGFGERIATRQFLPSQAPGVAPFCGYLNMSRGGELTVDGLTSTVRFELSTLASIILTNYLCNDLNRYHPVLYNEDRIKGNLLALVRRWTSLGKRVVACTGLPRAESTDGFVTLQNQSPREYEQVRLLLNDWLRDPSGFLHDLGPDASNVVVWDVASLVSATPEGQLDPNGLHWQAQLSVIDQGSITNADSLTQFSWTDQTKAWAKNALRGLNVRFTTGPCKGMYRSILSNGASSIVCRPFGKSPQVGDRYEVLAGILTSDGVHPTAEGHARIASQFDYRWLEPLDP